jgi:hypothetical protein
MRAAYQENAEARMTKDEGNPNDQMTKVLQEMSCHSGISHNAPQLCEGRSLLRHQAFVIDFQLLLSTCYISFVTRRCRVVTICAPSSARRDCISE